MDSLMFILLKLVLINNVITVVSVAAVEMHAPIVQGYVYCKSCQPNTLAGATPLPGAVVRLECNSNSTQKLLQEESTTNNNGYFAINTPSGTSAAEVEQCKVVLVSSSNTSSTGDRQQKVGRRICSIPTDINYGISGAVLKNSHKVVNKQNLSVVQAFTVGPFAFQPQTCSNGNGLDDGDPQCLLICGNGCCHCTY